MEITGIITGRHQSQREQKRITAMGVEVETVAEMGVGMVTVTGMVTGRRPINRRKTPHPHKIKIVFTKRYPRRAAQAVPFSLFGNDLYIICFPIPKEPADPMI